MGHNNCGAVKGAIDNAKLGNLTQLVEQIKPAISADTSDPAQLLTKTVQKNVENTITDIITKSPVIHDLVNKGEVKIVGAIYDLNTGMVHFL
jgi:carbonic anhydrase